LFDYTAGTHFVLKHGYPKKVIQLYDLTRAIVYLNLGNPEASGLVTSHQVGKECELALRAPFMVACREYLPHACEAEATPR